MFKRNDINFEILCPTVSSVNPNLGRGNSYPPPC